MGHDHESSIVEKLEKTCQLFYRLDNITSFLWSFRFLRTVGEVGTSVAPPLRIIVASVCCFSRWRVSMPLVIPPLVGLVAFL